jgi:hypothetical protein
MIVGTVFSFVCAALMFRACGKFLGSESSRDGVDTFKRTEHCSPTSRFEEGGL